MSTLTHDHPDFIKILEEAKNIVQQGKKGKAALHILSQTNLNRDKKTELFPYISDRKLANMLGIGKSTVYNGRKSLINKGSLDPSDDIVYAWRWSGDNTLAKIGITTVSNLAGRMPTTYHPTDDPILLGIWKCSDREDALRKEKKILDTFQRTRPHREWIIIDNAFNQVIKEYFYTPKFESNTISCLAEESWWRKTATWRLAKKLDLTVVDIELIRLTRAYEVAVERLMLGQRSPEEFEEWIHSAGFRNDMPSVFSKRMGLRPSVIPAMIERVRQSHCDIASGKMKAPPKIQKPNK